MFSAPPKVPASCYSSSSNFHQHYTFVAVATEQCAALRVMIGSAGLLEGEPLSDYQQVAGTISTVPLLSILTKVLQSSI